MCAKALLTRGRKGLPADGERGFYYPTATPRSTGRPNSFYNRTQTSDQGKHVPRHVPCPVRTCTVQLFGLWPLE